MRMRSALVGVIAIVAVAAAVVRFRGAEPALPGDAGKPRSGEPRGEPRVWSMTDSLGDGTPDFLRLDSPADRDAFRRWFTFLAEVHFHRAPEMLPAEINDCAALLRFAYRETLRRHDGEWAASMRLDFVPPVPPIAAYEYPFTPLKASLFRVRTGAFTAAELESDAFAQFADAETLMRRNTWLVSRDIAEARPGDLLFYRQLEQSMPFHAMVFVGRSHFEPPDAEYIVYHTGPDGDDPGEVRRPSVAELMRHPKPQWRPASGNPYFLGVHRWNILAD
jgi:uncharacterized protein YfaT (DUF1175 family)